MDDTVTCYQILEVQESASAPEIKAAYHKLAHSYHPDKVEKAVPDIPWVKQEAEERFRQINEAWDVLKDPQKRQKYDELLKSIRLEEQRSNFRYPEDESGSRQPSTPRASSVPPPKPSPPPPPPPPSPPPTVPPAGISPNATPYSGKTFSRGWAIALGLAAAYFFFQLSSAVIASSARAFLVRDSASLGVVSFAWILVCSTLFGVLITSILTKNRKRARGVALFGAFATFAYALVLIAAISSNRIMQSRSDPPKVGGAAQNSSLKGGNTQSSNDPHIVMVSTLWPQQQQSITITGSDFGTETAYTGDSDHIRVSDLTRGWNAGWTKDPGGDKATLVVTSWTDSVIIIGGFSGAYGSDQNSLNAGDEVLFQIWNAQTGRGPATYRMVATTLPISSENANISAEAGTAVRHEEESHLSPMPTESQPTTDLDGNTVPGPGGVSTPFPISTTDTPALPDESVQHSPTNPVSSADTRVEFKTDGDRRGTLDLFSDHIEYRDNGMGTGGGRAPYGPNPDNNFVVPCSEIVSIKSYGFRPIIFGSYEVVISARRHKFHIPALYGKTLAKAIRDKCGIPDNDH